MEMAHNSEHGRVVVSSGPFMTVTAGAPRADIRLDPAKTW